MDEVQSDAKKTMAWRVNISGMKFLRTNIRSRYNLINAGMKQTESKRNIGEPNTTKCKFFLSYHYSVSKQKSIHLPENAWLKVLFTDLLLEQNIVGWLKKYGL
jgi:hypothetical protein